MDVEQRGISLLMSFGYLSCVYRDIQRHIAHFLNLDAFFVRSVKLSPVLSSVKVIHQNAQGFIVVTNNDNIHYFDANGNRTRCMHCALAAGFRHMVLDDEVIICPVNKYYCKALGWVSREADGVYSTEKKIASSPCCFNFNGEIVRLEPDVTVFPNGVRIPSVMDCMMTLSSKFLLGVHKRGFDVYTKTGVHVFHDQDFTQTSSYFSFNDEQLAIFMGNGVIQLYDFTIFADASGPLPPTE